MVSLLPRAAVQTLRWPDRAVMYAGYHLFSNIANMVALSILAAMVQYRTRSYLGTNLKGSYHGDIEKVHHSRFLMVRANSC